MALLILFLEVNRTFIYEVLYAILFPALHRVEYGSLPVVVLMVRVGTVVDQEFHYIFIALTCRVKDGSLAIAINFIRFAAKLEEKPDDCIFSISSCVKDAGLT